ASRTRAPTGSPCWGRRCAAWLVPLWVYVGPDDPALPAPVRPMGSNGARAGSQMRVHVLEGQSLGDHQDLQVVEQLRVLFGGLGVRLVLRGHRDLGGLLHDLLADRMDTRVQLGHGPRARRAGQGLLGQLGEQGLEGLHGPSLVGGRGRHRPPSHVSASCDYGEGHVAGSAPSSSGATTPWCGVTRWSTPPASTTSGSSDAVDSSTITVPSGAARPVAGSSGSPSGYAPPGVQVSGGDTTATVSPARTSIGPTTAGTTAVCAAAGPASGSSGDGSGTSTASTSSSQRWAAAPWRRAEPSCSSTRPRTTNAASAAASA